MADELDAYWVVTRSDGPSIIEHWEVRDRADVERLVATLALPGAADAHVTYSGRPTTPLPALNDGDLAPVPEHVVYLAVWLGGSVDSASCLTRRHSGSGDDRAEPRLTISARPTATGSHDIPPSWPRPPVPRRSAVRPHRSCLSRPRSRAHRPPVRPPHRSGCRRSARWRHHRKRHQFAGSHAFAQWPPASPGPDHRRRRPRLRGRGVGRARTPPA
jgi:hypothetical protein